MRRGFILVPSTMCMVGVLALVGLANDVVRLRVAHDELQASLDEAALAASLELDGTSQGLARARTVARAGPGSTTNSWHFDRRTPSGVTVQFAAAPGGPFNAAPASAVGQRFVRVQGTGTVNLYVLPLVPGRRTSETVTAWAVAGQGQSSTMGDGLSPFLPDARNADPNFGFAAGQLYSIPWPPRRPAVN